MIETIQNKIKWKSYVKKWRNNNQHNSSIPACEFDADYVKVGKYTYGQLYVLCYGEKYSLSIGSFCSIASGVVFSLSADHYTNRLSTFPFKSKALDGPLTEAISKGDIIIEDDVWIGQNAIILSGVHIGQGAIVAAGAVVSNDVPAYSIVGGIPSNVIRYRFPKKIREYMLTLDFSLLTVDMIKEHIDDLYMQIDDLELNAIKEKFSWFPKKEEDR